MARAIDTLWCNIDFETEVEINKFIQPGDGGRKWDGTPCNQNREETTDGQLSTDSRTFNIHQTRRKITLNPKFAQIRAKCWKLGWNLYIFIYMWFILKELWFITIVKYLTPLIIINTGHCWLNICTIIITVFTNIIFSHDSHTFSWLSSGFKYVHNESCCGRHDGGRRNHGHKHKNPNINHRNHHFGKCNHNHQGWSDRYTS